MNVPSTRAFAVAGAAAIATLVASSSTAALPMIALSTLVPAALAFVAFAAQSQRLRNADRVVYQPVYVRRHDVQRRVRLADE